MLTGWSHILNWQRIYITHLKTTTDRHDLCLGKYHGAHSIDAAVHGSLPEGQVFSVFSAGVLHEEGIKTPTKIANWGNIMINHGIFRYPMIPPGCFWINSILSVSIRRTPNDPRECFGATGTIHHLESDQFLSINLFGVYLRFSQYWSHDNGTSIPPKKQKPNLMPFAEQVRISTIKGE